MGELIPFCFGVTWAIGVVGYSSSPSHATNPSVPVMVKGHGDGTTVSIRMLVDDILKQ